MLPTRDSWLFPPLLNCPPDCSTCLDEPPYDLSTQWTHHPMDSPPNGLSTGFVDVGRWWRTVWPPGGPCKAKYWFKFLKKCLKSVSNPSSPVCRASTLTIRPWMLGWVRLIRLCGAAATCVWLAYSLRPSHFDCLHREWSKLTRMEHSRGKAHARGCR